MNEKRILNQEIEHFDPIVRESRLWNMNYLIVAFIIGILIIILDISIISYWELKIVESVALSSILITIYSVFLFFLIEPRILREVERKSVLTKFVEGPVVTRTVEKPVLQYIEKPVFREVVKTVEKPIYLEKKKTMPKVKYYKYVGSTLTKKYLSSRSRLAKLIKKENRIYSNSAEEFEKRGFTPAKHVIKKMKGVKKKIALNKYKSRNIKKKKITPKK